MIESLLWFCAVMGAIFGLAYVIPRSILTSVTAYRKRHMELTTAEPPSVVCPMCGGKWDKWSKIHEESRPNNPSFPSTSGHHIIRSQIRTCAECGYGERRVL